MIDLVEVIRDLRGSLQEALAAAPDDGLRFELGPIELELTLAIEKSTNTGAKVRFWVVDAGAEGTSSRTSTHVVKLTMQPRVGTSDQSLYVSGPSESDEDTDTGR